VSTAVILSCSEDNITVIEPLNLCEDGIQNGDEVGVDCGGSCSEPCPIENSLEGVIVDRLVLSADIEYKLTGPLLIRDGAQLEIPAGTIIKAFSGKNAYIAVAQGGKIFVFGKADNPVIMTSDSENPAPGDWGGLVICGKAPTNRGEIVRSEIVDIFYGGNEVNDYSGFINFLRVEYTGEKFTESARFNGVSFYGVGSYTIVENVQSYEGSGDGFEFIGGTVDTKFLVTANSGENSISISEGWNGTGDSWYLKGASRAGIKISNNFSNESAIPISTGNISNVSIIGPVATGGLHYTSGGGVFTFDDLYTSNIDLGINVDNGIEVLRIDEGDLNIVKIKFDNPITGFLETNYSGSNSSFYIEGNTLGAGNGATLPDWASNWTIGF